MTTQFRFTDGRVDVRPDTDVDPWVLHSGDLVLLIDDAEQLDDGDQWAATDRKLSPVTLVGPFSLASTLR